jgi:hypothetical protein
MFKKTGVLNQKNDGMAEPFLKANTDMTKEQPTPVGWKQLKKCLS